MANHCDNYIIITTTLPPKLFFTNSDNAWEDEDTGDDSNWKFEAYNPKVFPEITDWWTKWFEYNNVTITRGPDWVNIYTISGTSAWAPPCEGFHHIYYKLAEYDSEIDILMYFEEPGCEIFGKWHNGEDTYPDSPILCYSKILDADIITNNISDESLEVFEQFHSLEDTIRLSEAVIRLNAKRLNDWADIEAIDEELENLTS